MRLGPIITGVFFDKKTQKHGISAKLFAQSIAFLDFCVITESEMNLPKI